MTSQFSLFLKSFSIVRKNLLLFVPMLLYNAALIPMGIAGSLLLVPAAALFALGSVAPGLVMGGIAFILLMAVILFISALYMASTGGLILDVLQGRKITFDALVSHARRYVKPLGKLILAYVAILVLMLVLAMAAVLPLVFGAEYFWVIILVYALVVPAAFLLWVLTFFSIPIVFVEGLSGFKALVAAFRYSMRNMKHVLSAVAILVLANLLTFGIIALLFIPLMVVGESSIALSLLLKGVFNLIYYAGSFVLGITEFIFIFLSYTEEKKRVSKKRAFSSAR
jgi:hypothetical protein